MARSRLRFVELGCSDRSIAIDRHQDNHRPLLPEPPRNRRVVGRRAVAAEDGEGLVRRGGSGEEGGGRRCGERGGCGKKRKRSLRRLRRSFPFGGFACGSGGPIARCVVRRHRSSSRRFARRFGTRPGKGGAASRFGRRGAFRRFSRHWWFFAAESGFGWGWGWGSDWRRRFGDRSQRFTVLRRWLITLGRRFNGGDRPRLFPSSYARGCCFGCGRQCYPRESYRARRGELGNRNGLGHCRRQRDDSAHPAEECTYCAYALLSASPSIHHGKVSTARLETNA